MLQKTRTYLLIHLPCLILFGFLQVSFSEYRRPFGTDAPWNRPVEGIPRHPQSDYYTDLLWNHASERAGNFNLNYDSYTYPVYEATSSTPQYPVVSSNPDWGNLHGRHMPFEASWTAAAGSDAQIIVLDSSRGYEWDLWQVVFENDTVKLSNGSLVQESEDPGDGSTPADYWTKKNGFKPSRGCGIQYLAMLVRPEEILAGVIEHALSMPVINTDGDFFVAPATKLEHPDNPTGIPEGMRFAIDVTDTEIEAWISSLPTALPDATRTTARIIARALRDYGWIITDTSGSAHWQFEYIGTAPEWVDLGLDTLSADWKYYPRDLMDGLVTKERIYALVPSDEYPAVSVNSSGAETPEPNDGGLRFVSDPSGSVMQILAPDRKKIYAIGIYSVSGTLVDNIDPFAGTVKINTGRLARGLYFVNITYANRVFSRRIVK